MTTKTQKGFSLGELLVVLAIFIIVVVAIFTFHLMIQRGYRQGESAAEITQNGRVILERITREIRQAREIVTELPDAPDSEVPPTAVSAIEFEDGHRSEFYYYIHYFKEDNEIKKEVKRYYFSSNPSDFLPWNATSSEEDLSSVIIEGPDVIGEYVSNLSFWGSSIINVFLRLEKDGKEVNFKTKIFGRNL